MTDAAPHHGPHGLLRVLGLVFGMAVVVGGVIGSGIMRAPGLVAQGLGSPGAILIAWTIGGVVALIAAMPVVEAGSSVPLAGGPFPIAERAFGRTVGFFTGWIGWLSYAASTAFIASVFGEYVHRLGLAQGVSEHVLACALILAVSVVNWIGTRVSGASQSVASALKGAFFVVLIVVLFVSPRSTAQAPVGDLAKAGTFAAVVMAARLIYQTYAGWDAAIYFSEEVHRPDRNVARATFWGIILCAVVYVLVNASALHVMSPAALAGSTLAVGDAAKVSLGAAANTVITAFGLFSLAAIVNLQVMVATRITYRMARHGSLPPLLGEVAPGGTPRNSLILLTLASFGFAATGGYESIVRLYTPWTVGVVLMVCLSSIGLRWHEPDLPRPWKMPLFPWVAILASLIQAGLIVVAVWDDPVSGALSAIAAVAPIPLYWLMAPRWRARATEKFG